MNYSTYSGEPKGRSGLPILNILKLNQIVDAVIFVVCYFGESKLDITGFINAYGMEAEGTIENAKVINGYN